MSDLIPSTLLTTVCAHRDAALAKMREAIQLMADGHAAAEEAERLATTAHSCARFDLVDRYNQADYQRLFTPVNVEKSYDLYRKHLDARVWTHLLEITGMASMMDKTAKDEHYAALCTHVPEVTEDNVRATLSGLREDAKLIFARGLARAFSDLDRRFKSHDAFMLGSRIILTGVFSAFGGWNYGSRMRDTLIDVERVFAILDGQKPDAADFVTEIGNSRGNSFAPTQGYVETRYFRVRTFKNGNAHLWFTRDDLVLKANLLLAEYYGPVLPDAYTEDVTVEDVRTTALSKDLAFYPTPGDVVDRVLAHLHLPAGARVLEPSAGEGAFVRGLLTREPRLSVDAVEVDPDRVRVLHAIRHPGLTVQHANFLAMHAVPVYDLVVMNPPFAGTHWMAHVRHAFDFLKPGGRLVAVLPVSAVLGDTAKHVAFRRWVEEECRGDYDRRFMDLPAESFKASGTRINTTVLTMSKRVAR